jgi:hypothetical protein
VRKVWLDISCFSVFIEHFESPTYWTRSRSLQAKPKTKQDLREMHLGPNRAAAEVVLSIITENAA